MSSIFGLAALPIGYTLSHSHTQLAYRATKRQSGGATLSNLNATTDPVQRGGPTNLHGGANNFSLLLPTANPKLTKRNPSHSIILDHHPKPLIKSQ